MRIAIAGKMRSGKDTLAKHFIDDLNFKKLAFGEGIEKVGHDFFPNIMAKGKNRKFYQHVGQSFREIDPRVWINYLDKRLQDLHSKGIENFIVTDVRQVNEYHYLKEQGFVMLKVEAEEEVRRERIEKAGDIFSPEQFYHETEKQVDSIPADYILTNNTTLQDFVDQINYVYREIKGEERYGE